MPKIVEEDKPKHLAAYLFHGLDLQGSPNASGDCPFCGREGKFGVHVDTGQFRCLVCDEKGNATSFLRKLHDQSMNGDVGPLAKDRGISEETLKHWGVTLHEVTGDYCLPGYDASGKLMQLYRYEGKIVKATTGIKHQLFGVSLFDKKKPVVVVCEGPWDAMKLWEELGKYKRLEGGEIVKTGNESSSLRSTINVIGIPGCGSVGEPFSRWCPLFDGKRVLLAFDNDHPREKDGKVTEGAALSALKRASQIILTSGVTIESLEYVKWGTDFPYDTDLPSGYDLRDLLTDNPGVGGLQSFFDSCFEVPAEWYSGAKKKGGKGPPEIELTPCDSWKELINAWRKALKWGDGLDKGLAVMLASVVSTKALGDQLWVMVVGPPACGKSTLCEALAVNKKYILSKSTLRGFHSGFDDGSGENHSPLKAMQDKTLVIKDGDTLLQSPNLSQILSEARDVYDRVSRSSYRTKASKDWEGLNITIVLCGTSSLRQLDTSELGERFLKCVMMDEIDVDREREIMMRVVHRAKMSLAFESNGQQESQHEPSMLKAMQMTGGYVSYLRENARELFAGITIDDSINEKLVDLSLYVAYMRARPSKTQDETTEREMGTRLASQTTRIAYCLAVVMGKGKVDEEVMARVKSVAMDTARGQTTMIAKYLDETDREGMGLKSVASDLNIEEGKCNTLLKFLRHIKVTQKFTKKSATGIKTSVKWRLTESFQSLYRRVMNDA